MPLLTDFIPQATLIPVGGNLGLGTTIPNQRLTVVGNISATGNLQVSGDVLASGKVTAGFSDKRLKTVIGPITNPLTKVNSLSGVYYRANDVARELGYNDDKVQVGISAQEVEKILPEAVSLSPIDTFKNEDNVNISKTANNYLTVEYEKLVPLLVEAINELSNKIKNLESKLV